MVSSSSVRAASTLSVVARSSMIAFSRDPASAYERTDEAMADGSSSEARMSALSCVRGSSANSMSVSTRLRSRCIARRMSMSFCAPESTLINGSSSRVSLSSLLAGISSVAVALSSVDMGVVDCYVFCGKDKKKSHRVSDPALSFFNCRDVKWGDTLIWS